MSTEAVRKNWCGSQQYDLKVVRHAICECLKHAPQREARRLKRLAKDKARIEDISDIFDEDLEF